MEFLRALIFLIVLLELAARLGDRLDPGGRLEQRWSQGLAAATLVFSLAALLLSVPGWLTPAVVQAVTGPGLLGLFRSKAWRDLSGLPGPTAWLLGAAAALFGLLATVPNTHWDAQVYHYTLPRLYLEHGAVYWTGTGIYDSLTSLAHPLYAWAMGCGGEPAANLLGGVFLAMLSCSMMSLAVPLPGRYVLALIVSSPLLVAQADGGLTDLAGSAYVAAMLAGGQNRMAWVWGVAAVLTRLNAALAVLLWALALGRARWLALALLAGLLPWMGFNLLHRGALFYPFGTLWSLGDFRGEADSPLLHGWAVGVDSRSWSSLLSPLVLPGLLLWRGKARQPVILFGLAGLLASALLLLAQPRYQLPWLLGVLVWSSWGWGQQLAENRWLTRLFWLVAALSSLVSVSAWGPKLVYALGGQTQSDYLRTRIPSWGAYQWLATTTYSKVLLTDPRSFPCPKPFALIDQGPITDLTYPGVIEFLTEQRCDAIVWNLGYPRVARAVLWQSALTAQEDRAAMSRQLIGSLGQAWLDQRLAQWPELQHPLTAPADYDPVGQKLRVLYFLCAKSRPVFQDGQVLVTEWPVKVSAR